LSYINKTPETPLLQTHCWFIWI